MKNLICILSIVTFLSGCDGNSFLEKIGLKDKDLTGEVFVVTNSGQSIKLGLVEVIAFPEKDLTTCVNEKMPDWTTKNQDLFKEYTLAQESLKNQQTSLKIDRFSINMHIEAIKMGQKDTKEEKKKFDEQIRNHPLKIVETEKAEIKLSSLKKQYELFKKGSFILDCAKTNIVTKAITNADGQFSMKVPNEKIAIFAKSSRNITDEPEEYYWLIRVDSDIKHVMLSNNNTYETLCQTCIVKTLAEELTK
jgi:hypothetical protein